MRQSKPHEGDRDMETEDPSSALHLHQNGIIKNPVGAKCTTKRLINRCKVCRKKFRNRDLYIAHVKLHKVTRRVSRTTTKTSEKVKDLVYECRICCTKHVGFLQCFEHQRLHEQHSKYFNELSTSENNKYHHLLNNGNKHNVQPAEVIIAMPEDIELLAANTVVSENGSHRDADLTNEIQSSDRECFITSSVNGTIVDVNGVDSRNVVLTSNIDACDADVSNDATNNDIHVNDELNVSHHTHGMDEIHTDTETDVLQHDDHVPITFPSHIDNRPAMCKLVDGDHAMQIDVPRQVKAIYLNNVGSDLSDVYKKLDELDQKVDAIIKHLNKINSMDNQIPVESEDGILVDPDQEKELESEDHKSVILETFPPSYSIIQAAKEQQQQEYYAATIANRQGQLLFKGSEGQKGVEGWLPASLSLLNGNHEEEQECKTRSASSASSLVPKHVIEKVFVESRSRANFAKNMCFAIFSVEERHGKNCTGRVYGKAQHKGQLDPGRVQAIKEATFRKYPCNPCLVDITWRKECVTAIDSGLRNENRIAKVQPLSQPLDHHPEIHILMPKINVNEQ